MSFMRLLFLLAVAGLAFHWWQSRQTAASLAAAASPNGFVVAAMPDGASFRTVVVLAPQNCPSDGARRADALAADLEGRHIPVLRLDHYSVNSENPSEERRAEIDRAVQVLNGEVPAVFVNGMAKSNPSLDEVVAEYHRVE